MTGSRRRVTSIIMAVCLASQIATAPGFAMMPDNPEFPPATQILASTAPFTPVIIKGVVIHPEDPLKFDFLMDTGTSRPKGDTLRQEADRTIKYFLAALTVPEKDLWVNLSPVEKDRIIPEASGQTIMGRDLLE